MHWTARLNCSEHLLPLKDTAVEILHWAYSGELRDNVPHRHTYFEVCLMGAYGAGVFTVEGVPHPIGPGDLFIARPGVVHQIQNTGPVPMELYWVAFSWPPPLHPGTGSHGELDGLWRLFAHSNLLIAPDTGSLLGLWQTLANIADCPEVVGREFQINALCGALLIAIAQSGSGPLAPLQDTAPEGPDKRQDLARLAVRYIHDNLHRPLTVDELARHVYLSTRHLGRVFREHTGVAPLTYIVTARMNRARHLLLHSDLSLKKIAADTGYPDPHHFSRVFTQRFGIAPSKLRRDGATELKGPEPGELV